MRTLIDPTVLLEEHVARVFREVGGLLNGHFVLAAGNHAGEYINKRAILPYPLLVSRICRLFAMRFFVRAPGCSVQVVVGPEKAGVTLAQWTAYHLYGHIGSHDPEVLSIPAAKDGKGGFVFEAGWDELISGRSVLVVEDVITTGGSVRKVIDLIRVIGGEVMGVAVIWNRGDVTAEDLGVDELFCLVNRQLPTYPEDDCPLCAEGVPISTNVGHGAEFLAEQGK